MAVGIWTCVDHAYMEQLLGTNLYMSAAYILIATGVVVILISFLGCFGAVKEIKCMLLTVRRKNVFCMSRIELIIDSLGFSVVSIL